MRFSFSEEQEEFRGVLRRFLGDVSPTTEVRRLMETDLGYEPEVWRRLSSELGLTALHIPEEYGGQGYGLAELAIALEEMGRCLLCAPFFASAAMASMALLNAGTEAEKRELLPPLAAGEKIASLAVTEDSGVWTSKGIATTAETDGEGAVLRGHKSFVLDGLAADSFIIVARTPGSAGHDGLGFYLVDGAAEGLKVTPLKAMDPTRKLTRLELNGVQARSLGAGDDGAAALHRTLNQAALLLANEMVGGAERLREDTLEYTKMRVQFGRPIASFQAIKHRSADILLDVELAKSAAYYAAAAADEDDPELPALAALAKAAASDAYMRTAIESVQLHGGIGFTWENDTHLWFKRAKSSEVLLGTPAHHRELMLRHWQV